MWAHLSWLAAGAFDSSYYGAGFVDGFFEFVFRDGVGDDAGSGLDVSFLALLQQGADRDAGVEVSGVVGVEDAAAVDAAARGFELFDNFHGTDFGRTSQGYGREAGAECVDGVEFGAQLTFNGTDDMHDVGVAFDRHQFFDFDGAVFTDAAYVVASEIDEHDVLG